MAVNGKSRRSYRGAPVSNTLGVILNAAATSITLATAMSGWSTDGEPFFVVVDPGTSKEEKICVKYATSTTLTVVDPAATSTWGASTAGRGADNTTDQSHAQGAVIYPVFTATEANQNNELVSKYANAGSVVYQGSGTPGTFTELAIGTASQVLTVNSGATAPQWSAIVNANVSASAAIALSKLATGALPTDITIASANIVNGTIAAVDLADAAVTSPKLAAPTLTSKTDSFTLALVDANCTMQCNKATAMTLTVPTSSIAFANGAVVTVVNYGAGQVTIVGDTGVTVRSANGLKLRVQYSVASLIKISDTEWVLTGDTAA
jgi:hypothetical protein